MKLKSILALVILALLLTGCAAIQGILNDQLQKEDFVQPTEEDTLQDSVLSYSRVGTVPGRLILDYSPRPIVEPEVPVEENPGEAPAEDPVPDEEVPVDETTGEEVAGEETTGEDTNGEETNGEETPQAPERDIIDTIDELQPDGVPLAQLTEVENYLIDYQRQGTWVREALHKDGDRYNHERVDTEPTDEELYMARSYFSYFTEINDYLGNIQGFQDMELDLTMVYAKGFKDTDNKVFYFREYFPRTRFTTGNEGLVVMDKNLRLVHYLSYGVRNPITLRYEPGFTQQQGEKRLWRTMNHLLKGYVDDYVLEDFYLKIPTDGDFTGMRKEYKPQWFGDFVSPEASHYVHTPDKGGRLLPEGEIAEHGDPVVEDTEEDQ